MFRSRAANFVELGATFEIPPRGLIPRINYADYFAIMKVEICAQGKKIATGQVRPDGMIENVVPFEGRGIGYGRYVQIVATTGKHTGSSLTVLVMGDTGTALTLKEPMPFK